MTLRRGLLLGAASGLIGAVLLITLAHGLWQSVGYYCAFQTGVCLIAVLFERSGYRARVANPAALRRTEERTVDPVSGEVTEVWEDPATGERQYRPVSSHTRPTA